MAEEVERKKLRKSKNKKKKEHNFFIRIIHGLIFISLNLEELLKLISDYSSCKRFCFNRFLKDKNLPPKKKDRFNYIRKLAKAIYYPRLNVRYISDALMEAEGLYDSHLARKEVLEEQITNLKTYIKNLEDKEKKTKTTIRNINKSKRKLARQEALLVKNPIFGGKDLWDKVSKGNITKEEWKFHRDNQVYSRGDKSYSRINPNLFVTKEGEKYFLNINLTIGKAQKHLKHCLRIPKGYEKEFERLIDSKEIYNIRLIRKEDNVFEVNIDYSTEIQYPAYDFSNGILGVDTNPDRIAYCETTRDGNYVISDTKVNTRLYYASADKRMSDINVLAHEISDLALEKRLGIAFEDLNFENHKFFEDKGNDFNRTRSTFTWKKFLIALESCCIKKRIPYTKVDPAFTSIIGKLKYMKMYNLSVHESASFVIARRGLGFKEKLSLYKYPRSMVNSIVIWNLEWKKNEDRTYLGLWRKLRDNRRGVLTELKSRMSGVRRETLTLGSSDGYG